MSPPPLRPVRVRRSPTRILLFCGVFWIASCWSYVSFSLWSSLPHHTTTAPGGEARRDRASLPPMAIIGASSAVASSRVGIDGKRNRDSGAAEFSGKKNRHLSSSAGNATAEFWGEGHVHPEEADDERRQHYLRAKQSALGDRSAPPAATFVYPLHARMGTHHAYLYVGTPPQRQTLIVDTGSRLTAFPCYPHCPDCGAHASPPFRLNASSSHEIVVPCDGCQLNGLDFELEDYFDGGLGGGGGNSGDEGPGAIDLENGRLRRRRRSSPPASCARDDRCHLDQRYTEGSSWTAFEVRDRVWLGSAEEGPSGELAHAARSAPHAFGCQVSETGLFRSQYADGIMGLSMYTHTLPGSWTRRGSVPRPTFSLCLNREGGHIALGGTGSRKEGSAGRDDGAEGRHLAPMRFTPLAKQNVWHYTVGVTSISVGKHVLPDKILQFVNDHKGVIVDSGTTDTFISHKVAKPFVLAWQKITGRKYSNRLQKYTHQQFTELPIITFELDGGVTWDIMPEAYMEKEGASLSDSSPYKDGNINKSDNTAATHVNHDNNISSQMKRWDGTRGFISRVYVDEPKGVVLGSNAMMDKEIYFDVPNRRLGVARATCAY